MKIGPITIFMIAILMLFLQGCTNSSPVAVDFSNKELNVVSPFGDGDGYQNVYLQLVSAFETETGCKVNDNSEQSSEKWKLNVLDSFENGSEPDVLFFFTGETVEELIKNGKVVDFNTIRQYDSDYAMNINSGVLNTMKAADGLNYSVPVTGFWEGLYINKDLFDKYNISIPNDIEELIIAAELFNAQGIVPVAANLQATPHYWFEYMLYNYTGPSAHNANISREQLRTAMLDCFDALARLNDNGVFSSDIASDVDSVRIKLFTDKKAAMMLDGSWAAGSIADKDNVHVINVPAIESGERINTDIIGGFSMGYYITEKGWSENKEVAVAFVNAMTGEKALTAFNANGSASPGDKAEAAAASEFLKSTEAFIDSATAFTPALQDSFSKDAREYLFLNLLPVIEGKTDADTVLDEFFRLN